MLKLKVEREMMGKTEGHVSGVKDSRRFHLQFCLKLIELLLSQDPAMRKILLPIF